MGHANSRPSTRFTLQRLQKPSQTSRKVVAGPRPGMEISWRKITLSDDGKSYTSIISYAAFDRTGEQVEGGEGNGEGARMGFNAIEKFGGVLHRAHERRSATKEEKRLRSFVLTSEYCAPVPRAQRADRSSMTARALALGLAVVRSTTYLQRM